MVSKMNFEQALICMREGYYCKPLGSGEDYLTMVENQLVLCKNDGIDNIVLEVINVDLIFGLWEMRPEPVTSLLSDRQYMSMESGDWYYKIGDQLINSKTHNECSSISIILGKFVRSF